MSKYFNISRERLDARSAFDQNPLFCAILSYLGGINNGVVAFKNVLMTNSRIEDIFSQGDLDSLGNVLRNIVEQNREAPYVSNKPFDPSDISLLGKRFPDFNVTNASGVTVNMSSLLTAEVSPKMIFFFRVPPTHVFADASESMKEVTSPLQALGAMTNMSMGDEYTSILKRIEEELYGR